jgi:hypothetical protein
MELRQAEAFAPLFVRARPVHNAPVQNEAE